MVCNDNYLVQKMVIRSKEAGTQHSCMQTGKWQGISAQMAGHLCTSALLTCRACRASLNRELPRRHASNCSLGTLRAVLK